MQMIRPAMRIAYGPPRQQATSPYMTEIRGGRRAVLGIEHLTATAALCRFFFLDPWRRPTPNNARWCP